jgi:hypothetical protein
MFHSFSSLSLGHGAIFIPGHPNFAYRTAATFTGTSVNTWNTTVKIPDYTTLATLYDEFRIVSYGVRLFCQANPTESKGTLLLATLNELPVSPDIEGSLYAEYDRVAISECDANWIGRRVGSQSAQWNSFADTTNFDMTTLFVGITGCTASTAVLGVEIVINYELSPIQGTAATHVATPSPPSNPAVAHVVQNVTTSQPSTALVPTAKRSSNIWDLAMKAVDGLETYGPMLLTMM